MQPRPVSTVTAAVRLSSFQASVTTVPTPDVQEPYQRRSSLSLYAKRCEMLKRYHSSNESMDADCPSPTTTKCSVMEATAREERELLKQYHSSTFLINS